MSSRLKLDILIFLMKLKRHAVVYMNESLKTSLFSEAQVRLPSMDGRVALVPWADMLNHSCEV